MRIHFPDLVRPKRAAKCLVRAAIELKLATVHEVLARVLGYRDWHELSVVSSHSNPSPFIEVSVEERLRIILELSDKLGLPDAEVQYAVSKARLLREMPWTLDEQMTLRAAIWRSRLFGPPGRGKPGTVVEDKAYGANTPAYLRRAGRPTYLLFDTGLGERADFEVATPRAALSDFVPSRLWLPYGLWRLKDGSEVIFSRDYFPMWGISKDRVQRLAPWLWIKGIVDQSHFWKAGDGGWASSSAREMAIARLAAHRIFELPRLTDAMPHLFEADVDSMEDGVRRLYAGGSWDDTLPSYAEFNKRVLG
jgi:hypothetical protein